MDKTVTIEWNGAEVEVELSWVPFVKGSLEEPDSGGYWEMQRLPDGCDKEDWGDISDLACDLADYESRDDTP